MRNVYYITNIAYVHGTEKPLNSQMGNSYAVPRESEKILYLVCLDVELIYMH